MSGLVFVTRVVWAGVRWGVRHWRWSVVCAVLASGWWVIGWQRPAVVALLVGLVPAVVCGMWSTASPGSWELLVAGPVRRFGWWCWARTQWKHVARAVGSSVETSTRHNTVELSRLLGGGSRSSGGIGRVSTSTVVRKWSDPRLVRVLIRRDTMTLRVQVRRGLSVEELMTAGPRVRDAAGAYAVRCVLGPRPSLVDIRLVMLDPIAGTRLSALTPAVPVTVTPVIRRPRPVPVVLGRGEDGRDVVFNPADAWHVALQGATRSGKSALSYTLLGALAARPEVVVCGVDPSGILLGPWTSGRGSGWIATGTGDMTAAVEALSGVVAEMDRRIVGLTRDGLDKLDLFDARCPLLVVVLEEYPGTLSAAKSEDDAEGRQGADRVQPRIERAVGRLVKEGAKVGVRLVVLAQRMSAKAVDTDDRSNFGLRVTLRVDNGDAVTMLHDGPAARAMVEAARQFPPGMGLVEGPDRPLQRWRADLTTYPVYLAAVRTGITATAASAAPPAPSRPPAQRLSQPVTDPAPDEDTGPDAGTVIPAPSVPAPVGPVDITSKVDVSGTVINLDAAAARTRTPRKPRSPRAPRAPRQRTASVGAEDQP